MTPELRQICGCEICIIPKDMQIALNRPRKIFVTYLKHKYVGRHTCNSLFSTTSAEHYKDTNFPVGECLHANIKDAAQCITCITIKQNVMINIKRALGFWYEFTE